MPGRRFFRQRSPHFQKPAAASAFTQRFTLTLPSFCEISVFIVPVHLQRCVPATNKPNCRREPRDVLYWLCLGLWVTSGYSLCNDRWDKEEKKGTTWNAFRRCSIRVGRITLRPCSFLNPNKSTDLHCQRLHFCWHSLYEYPSAWLQAYSGMRSSHFCGTPTPARG